MTRGNMMRSRRAVRRGASGWQDRREVAKRCFDMADGRLAVARLNRWIKADARLRAALQACGYRPRTRRLQPAVVRVLRRYLY